MGSDKTQALEIVLADYILKYGLTKKAEAYFQTIFSDDGPIRNKPTNDAKCERDGRPNFSVIGGL